MEGEKERKDTHPSRVDYTAAVLNQSLSAASPFSPFFLLMFSQERTVSQDLSGSISLAEIATLAKSYPQPEEARERTHRDASVNLDLLQALGFGGFGRFWEVVLLVPDLRSSLRTPKNFWHRVPRIPSPTTCLWSSRSGAGRKRSRKRRGSCSS